MSVGSNMSYINVLELRYKRMEFANSLTNISFHFQIKFVIYHFFGAVEYIWIKIRIKLINLFLKFHKNVEFGELAGCDYCCDVFGP